ncbi:hypothetical protein NLI96_g4916 [Meripilus lineatus]|uniref:FAD/NAD(P)-binding domain-containing protein n=1 Tax=Meripilus lineatus TaxID=2056292 RepID=A0AAD5YJG7_9APHY|nr:hypothetical protein NLI96_g4916 [Physisporinus lineatus]
MTTPRSSLAKRLGLDEKWKEFVSGVVVLLFSAVCTTPEEMVWDMPVEEVLDYVYNTFGTHHYVAQNGVRDVAKRLTNWIPSKNVHLSTSIASISLSPAATPVPAPNLPPTTTPDTPPPTTPAPVTVPGRVPPRPAPIPVPVAVPESSPDSSTPTTEPTSPTTPQQPSQDQEPVKKKRTVDIHCADGQVYEGFDHIIFATQANQAVPLLTSYLNSFAAPPVTPATPATPEQPTTQEEASNPPAEDDQHEEKEELRIHSTYVQSQISCLSQFTYCPTIVINHTDSTLLPSNNQDWRDLNLVVSSAPPSETPTTTTPETPAEGGQEKAGIMGEEGSKGGDGDGRMVLPTTYTMVTHVLPPPADYTHTHTQTPSQPQQPSAPAPAPAQPAVTLHTQMRTQEKVKSFPQIYQTTNPIIAPKLENVLSVAHLERAVVDVKAKRALKGLWREKWDTTPLAVNEDEQTTLDEDQSNNPGLRWGTAGSDGGVLGPLQGAGKVLAVPPESDDKAQISEKNVVQDVPGIWLCGSYAHTGIPLLEGCVVSARNVVEQGIWTAEGLDTSKVEKLW